MTRRSYESDDVPIFKFFSRANLINVCVYWIEVIAFYTNALENSNLFLDLDMFYRDEKCMCKLNL